MSAQNSVRSYLGIAKETTQGTKVAPTAFIPVAIGKLKAQDLFGELLDDGLRGANVKDYNYIQGRKHSEIEFGGHDFADTIPWAIAGLLGDVTTTGSSAPYTHAISLENSTATGVSSANPQPTSFTLTDFYAANVRSYPGCIVHDFTLNFNADGLIEYDAKATGWSSSVPTTPSPSFTVVIPTPVWAATVTLGGTAVSNSVEGNIHMSRPVTPIFGIANTQDPYTVFAGALEVKGQLRFVMEDDTQLTAFLSQDSANLPALVINWAQGSGASATQLQATLSKRAYTVAVIDRSKDFVEIVVDIIGLGNTTDIGTSGGYSPIKWTVKNAIAAGTYQ